MSRLLFTCPALVALAAPALVAQDLGQVYTSTLEYDEEAPVPLAWDCTEDDVWRVSSFRFEVGDELELRLRAATVVFGHADHNVLWAAVLPDRTAKIGTSLAGDGESLQHVWLRFHPSRVTELFPASTIKGNGPAEALLWAFRICDHKLKSFWAKRRWVTGADDDDEEREQPLFSGYRPIVPPRNNVIVDIDTEEGARRVYAVSLDTGRVEYKSALLTKALPPLEPIERRDSLRALEASAELLTERYEVGERWDEWTKAARKRASRADNVFETGLAIYELMEHLQDRRLRVRIGRDVIPALVPKRHRNASQQGTLEILQDAGRTEHGLSHGKTPYGVAYIRPGSLGETGVVEDFDELLETFGDQWGLIVDLRFGITGPEDVLARLAGRFVSEPVTYGFHGARVGGEERTELALEPRGPWCFAGSLVVLIGAYTAGPAERLAMMLARSPRATLMGGPTAGLGFDADWHPAGSGIELFLVGGESFDADGRAIGELGVPPDLAIETTEADFSDVQDTVLWKALEQMYETPQLQRACANPANGPWKGQ